MGVESKHFMPEIIHGVMLYEGRGFMVCCAFERPVVEANKTYAEVGPPNAFSVQDPTLLDRSVHPLLVLVPCRERKSSVHATPQGFKRFAQDAGEP